MTPSPPTKRSAFKIHPRSPGRLRRMTACMEHQIGLSVLDESDAMCMGKCHSPVCPAEPPPADWSTLL